MHLRLRIKISLIWYDFWTPLEIRRAFEGANLNKKEATAELERMKSFLLKHL
jgi:hypothetical protein